MTNLQQTGIVVETTFEDFNHVYRLLGKLVNCVELDKEDQYSDCLSVFSDYDWQVKAVSNQERFQQLMDKGIQGSLSMEEMDEFMDMVSDEGSPHIYHTLRMSELALKKYSPIRSLGHGGTLA